MGVARGFSDTEVWVRILFQVSNIIISMNFWISTQWAGAYLFKFYCLRVDKKYINLYITLNGPLSAFSEMLHFTGIAV